MATLDHLLRDAGYRIEYGTYFFWLLPLPILFFRTLRSAGGGSTTRSRSHHRAGGAFLRHVAEACFAFEAGRIARGSMIPFGGSCLVVATPARA